MHKTFIAALLSAAEASAERTAALKAMTTEPEYQKFDVSGRLVIFSTPVFTLIVRQDARNDPWSYRWTWTDTAAR